MDDDENGTGDIDLDYDDEGGETGKKKLLFIIIAVVLLLLGSGGAFFMMNGSDEAENQEVAGSTDKSANPAGGEGARGVVPNTPVFYDVPEFLVDLNTSDRRKSSFLKMKVSIELASQQDVKTLEAYMPRVRDNFITYLRELRASDLSGSAGLYRLREELMLRINQAIAPAKVNNILFKEIIVQ